MGERDCYTTNIERRVKQVMNEKQNKKAIYNIYEHN